MNVWFSRLLLCVRLTKFKGHCCVSCQLQHTQMNSYSPLPYHEYNLLLCLFLVVTSGEIIGQSKN